MAEKLGKFGASGLIVIFACGMTMLKYWGIDNDGWFLLNCGRYVVETGIIPHTEFATMHEGFDYVMHQWLTAVLFWEVYSKFGADALISLAWLIGFVLMFVYYRLCVYVSDGNRKVSALMSFAVSLVVYHTFLPTRPYIISTLILVVELFLLEKFVRERKLWTLCALPILAVILVNMHAAIFPMSIIVLLPYLAQSLYAKFKSARDSELPLLPLIVTAVAMFLAGFINPYGWDAMTYTLHSYNMELLGTIFEIKPPNIYQRAGLGLYIFSGLLVAAHCKKIMPLRYSLLSFGIMLLAFQSYRNVLLFLTLATFPVAFAAKDWHPFDKYFNFRYKLFIPLLLLCIPELYKLQIMAAESPVALHLPMIATFSAAIIFLVCFIFFYRREGKLFSEEIFILRRKPLIALATIQAIFLFSWLYYTEPAPEYEGYKPALDFLLSENRAEDIILWTGFKSGAYAEFRGVKTYMDPRPEIFALENNHKKEVAREYFDLASGKLDYEEFFSRYNFTHIFVTTWRDSLLYHLLSRDKNYRQVFEFDVDEEEHGKIFVPVEK